MVDVRENKLTVMLADIERLQLDALADTRRQTASDYIRTHILEAFAQTYDEQVTYHDRGRSPGSYLFAHSSNADEWHVWELDDRTKLGVLHRGAPQRAYQVTPAGSMSPQVLLQLAARAGILDKNRGGE